MNIPLLSELVSLQYRLLWANVRTRNGRIFLFLAGILVFGLFAALVLFGGIAGGLIAVRSKGAERMAQGALSMLFFQSILVANLLGMGMNAIFSETELRCYPLTAVDRLVSRHLIAILDPFWFVYLAFYLGLALGLFFFGAGGVLPATAAALLLLLCNYAAARGAGLAIERLTVRTAGTEILIAGALLAVLAIALAAHAISADASRMEAFYP
jgi:hypothetical protein